MRIFHFMLLALGALIAMPSTATTGSIDWTRTVVLSPSGGHVLGNPAAKTQIVEFISYTCPHCAHFEAEGSPALKSGWVRPGMASIEVRNLVRDRYDLTAALLARCGGPQRFFGNHQAIFAQQTAWVEKLQAYEAAPSTLPESASQTDIMQDIADKTGLSALMGKRGYRPAQLHACIADPKAMAIVLAMTRDATGHIGVTGTPSFLINRGLTDAHDWRSLRALLAAALPGTRT